MGEFLVPIITVVIWLLDLYKWIIIVTAVASWLIAFGVINTYNRTVARMLDVLYRLTEPVLRPIRRIIPLIGGVDLSPLVLILLLWFIRDEIVYLLYTL